MEVNNTDYSSQLSDEKQQKLYELLIKLDPCLASLYYEGIKQFDSTPQPNANRIRVAMICHCFRELMNSTPEAFGFKAGSHQSEQNDCVKELSNIWKVYHPISSEMPKLATQDEHSSESELVTVEKNIRIAAERIVVSHESGSRTNRENAALFIGDARVGAPAVEAWMDAKNFFVPHAHFNRSFNKDESELPIPTDDTISKHINAVEIVLCARLDCFFDTLDELEDIIAEANGCSTGDKR